MVFNRHICELRDLLRQRGVGQGSVRLAGMARGRIVRFVNIRLANDAVIIETIRQNISSLGPTFDFPPASIYRQLVRGSDCIGVGCSSLTPRQSARASDCITVGCSVSDITYRQTARALHRWHRHLLTPRLACVINIQTNCQNTTSLASAFNLVALILHSISWVPWVGVISHQS